MITNISRKPDNVTVSQQPEAVKMNNTPIKCNVKQMNGLTVHLKSALEWMLRPNTSEKHSPFSTYCKSVCILLMQQTSWQTT